LGFNVTCDISNGTYEFGSDSDTQGVQRESFTTKSNVSNQEVNHVKNSTPPSNGISLKSSADKIIIKDEKSTPPSFAFVKNSRYETLCPQSICKFVRRSEFIVNACLTNPTDQNCWSMKIPCDPRMKGKKGWMCSGSLPSHRKHRGVFVIWAENMKTVNSSNILYYSSAKQKWTPLPKDKALNAGDLLSIAETSSLSLKSRRSKIQYEPNSANMGGQVRRRFTT